MRKIKQFEYKNGIATRIVSSNPSGNNQHIIKVAKVVPKPLTQEELYNIIRERAQEILKITQKLRPLQGQQARDLKIYFNLK